MQGGIEAKIDRLTGGLIPGVGPTGQCARVLPYVLLGASLLANIAVPPPSLLLDPPVLRYAAATILAFLPVFFANLVFSASFRDSRSADIAFASNVLGAVWRRLRDGEQ